MRAYTHTHTLAVLALYPPQAQWSQTQWCQVRVICLQNHVYRLAWGRKNHLDLAGLCRYWMSANYGSDSAKGVC